MKDDTCEIAKKMCRALVESRGCEYATGYLQSYLVSIIEKYVNDPADRILLHIEMLNIAIDNKLDKLENKA
jgi:hypothetical protein